jgi:hypothetical protein
MRLNRREFCGAAAAAGAALLCPARILEAEVKPRPGAEPPGTWPTARQNRCLTGIQPLAGKMTAAPGIVAEIAFARNQGALTGVASKPNGPVDRAVAIENGRLRCYRLDASLLWETHPAGLNFESLVIAEDLDGDGRVELALMAGRPTAPLGAAVLVAADSGAILFRYDVEPMSYWWTMQAERLLPDRPGKQLVVCEHGYPPDAKFGYLVLLAFEKPGEPPTVRWRYDFDHYTCFPSLLVADVNGDGANELCVVTHSRMWVLDGRTGKVNQFLSWDVAPANVRSYGLVRFQDLNGDGLPEFICIANFSQHHEVLINEKGTLKLAWTHGWGTSVTTQTVATTWPDPPIADVDGDGRLEMVVNMFATDGEPRWMVRIYDALTGALKATAPDRVATFLRDVDQDGAAELLADITADPTLTNIQGACVLKVRGKDCAELWKDDGARSTPVLPSGRTQAATKPADAIFVRNKTGTRRLDWKTGTGIELSEGSPPTPPAGPDFSRIPAPVSPVLNPPLVADVDGDGKNEVIHWYQGRVTAYRYEGAKGFAKLYDYPSAAAPALADLDGDGKLELVVGEAGPTVDPVIHALRPGRKPETLWKVTLTPRERKGLPHGAALTFQTGRFLGRSGHDLYVYVGTPHMRSLVLNGGDGTPVWEKAKIPDLERYYGPTVNLSAVWDVNGDGKDDLVFTCPDYYCVASGPTGEPLVGPAYPPDIFKQPSQGLYTLPAILPQAQGEPLVCLIDGHYFLAAMTAHAAAKWYQLPVVGKAHAGAEGFLQTPKGEWLIGFGQQDGQFVCLDVATGKPRWEYAVRGTASAVSACDIDGDGVLEFLFGTSHGEIYALADDGTEARRVWKATLPAKVGAPIVADVDNDGTCEILVGLGDGRLCLLRAPKRRT